MDKYQLIKAYDRPFNNSFRAINMKTGNQVFIQTCKAVFNSLQQVQKQRAIKCYSKLEEIQGIPKLLECIFQQSKGKLSLVYELMEMSLYQRMISHVDAKLTDWQIRLYMYQVLKTLSQVHQRRVIHRHIRPESIYLKGKHAKIGQWELGRNNKANDANKEIQYTQYIGCRWYRAPETLITDGYYCQSYDIWSFGCVLYELYTNQPLFPGKSQMQMIDQIHQIFGSPQDVLSAKFSNQSISRDLNFEIKKGIGLRNYLIKRHFEKDVIEILQKLLVYNAEERISAEEALKEPYFNGIQAELLKIKNHCTQETKNEKNNQSSNESK